MLTDTEKIKTQLLRYCSMEERCEQQVREKAVEKGMSNRDIHEFIVRLKHEGYLNEQRFATIFATSKLHQNKWGPEKITWELLQRNIDRKVIRKALQTVEEEEFVQTACQLIQKKYTQWQHLSAWEQEQKMKQFLHGKGYSPQLIVQAIQSLHTCK